MIEMVRREDNCGEMEREKMVLDLIYLIG